MGEYAIGQAVTRREDPRLLKGLGRYLDDISLPRETRAFVLRSPHAHAEIRAIDTAAAKAMPGVLAVLTGADYRADGLGSIPVDMARNRRDGSPMFVPDRPAMAVGRVVRVGMPVALVVAETLAQAKDAAETISVDYAALPHAVSTADALEPDTPVLWPEGGSNEACYYQAGDPEATERAFAAAAHVVGERYVITRITANAMEPRGAIGEFDPGTGRYTLTTGLQRPYLFRRKIAEDVLHIDEPRLHLIASDIGGSFGLRGAIYPELILVLWGARRVGRPVKWICERSEALATDDHARDNVTDAELALDADGGILAMRARTNVNLGAQISLRGIGAATGNIGSLVGVYTIAAAHVAVSCVLTNTSPTAPYRGAGRPEAAYVIESLLDRAARALGIDRAEIRRRNMIPPAAMPFKTALTYTYDSGEFEACMDRALEIADYTGFEARRAETASRGRLRGLGISTTIEQAAGASIETAELRFDPTGTVTMVTGSVAHGQGHETILTQILCDRLGVAPDSVSMIQGDTDKVAFSTGTGGSRSTTLSGGATVAAAEKIVEKGKRIAAHLLECAEADIGFAAGRFSVAGTDRSVDLVTVAKTAFMPDRLPPTIEPGLYETATYRAPVANFPNACHITEVEIDPDTGTTELMRYTIVDDVGTVINPLLLKGQIVGGLAQGAGQALFEDIHYDPETGQLLTGSFMDYTMPRASDFCAVEVESRPVPTATNPLGVKGAGEAGTVGALPAVLSAIRDALVPLGVVHFEMPATPERVWRAMQDAQVGN